MTDSNKKFLIYLTSYLGVALVGGSIVHMGTLDINSSRYITLAFIGIGLMIVGNILEAQINKEIVGIKYFSIAAALAIATGFLSGGIQHYLDDPIYAGYLLAIGVVVAYITFMSKYHLQKTTRGLLTAVVIALLIVLTSNTIVHEAVPHGGATHQH
jgi:hypothetical protein